HPHLFAVEVHASIQAPNGGEWNVHSRYRSRASIRVAIFRRKPAASTGSHTASFRRTDISARSLSGCEQLPSTFRAANSTRAIASRRKIVHMSIAAVVLPELDNLRARSRLDSIANVSI